MTYDWECKTCGHIWEVWGMNLREMPPTTNCEKCGSKFIDRVILPPHIHFHHTDKEVRIPSKPTSVYIRRDKK